jgi:hypothetical protein
LQASVNGEKMKWLVVCRKNMPFITVASSNVIIVKEVPDTIFSRAWFELIEFRRLMRSYRIDALFSIFAPSWLGYRGKSVAGCAYSNLFYLELNFWKNEKLLIKLWRSLIDKYRMRRFLVEDVRIMETEDLANRAIGQHNLSRDSVRFVRSAVSFWLLRSHDMTRLPDCAGSFVAETEWWFSSLTITPIRILNVWSKRLL